MASRVKIPTLPLEREVTGSSGRKGRKFMANELLTSPVGGDGLTPRSITILASENIVMRMPDSTLMFKQQSSLQDMLADIHEDPNGFKDFINDIRSEFRAHTDAVPSPFDSRCGTLSEYNVDETKIVGRGRFSVVYYATRNKK